MIMQSTGQMEKKQMECIHARKDSLDLGAEGVEAVWK
jgi:hypothetical protein